MIVKSILSFLTILSTSLAAELIPLLKENSKYIFTQKELLNETIKEGLYELYDESRNYNISIQTKGYLTTHSSITLPYEDRIKMTNFVLGKFILHKYLALITVDTLHLMVLNQSADLQEQIHLIASWKLNGDIYKDTTGYVVTSSTGAVATGDLEVELVLSVMKDLSRKVTVLKISCDIANVTLCTNSIAAEANSFPMTFTNISNTKDGLTCNSSLQMLTNDDPNEYLFVRYCPLFELPKDKMKFYKNKFQLFNRSKTGLAIISTGVAMRLEGDREVFLQTLAINIAGNYITVVDLNYTYLVSLSDLNDQDQIKNGSFIPDTYYSFEPLFVECFRNYPNVLSCYTETADNSISNPGSSFVDFLANSSMVLKMPPIKIDSKGNTTITNFFKKFILLNDLNNQSMLHFVSRENLNVVWREDLTANLIDMQPLKLSLPEGSAEEEIGVLLLKNNTDFVLKVVTVNYPYYIVGVGRLNIGEEYCLRYLIDCYYINLNLKGGDDNFKIPLIILNNNKNYYVIPATDKTTLEYPFIGGEVFLQTSNHFYGWNYDLLLKPESEASHHYLTDLNEDESISYLRDTVYNISLPAILWDSDTLNDPTLYFSLSSEQRIMISIMLIQPGNRLSYTSLITPIEFLTSGGGIAQTAYKQGMTVIFDEKASGPIYVVYLKLASEINSHFILASMNNETILIYEEEETQESKQRRLSIPLTWDQKSIIQIKTASNIQGTSTAVYIVEKFAIKYRSINLSTEMIIGEEHIISPQDLSTINFEVIQFEDAYMIGNEILIVLNIQSTYGFYQCTGFPLKCILFGFYQYIDPTQKSILKVDPISKRLYFIDSEKSSVQYLDLNRLTIDNFFTPRDITPFLKILISESQTLRHSLKMVTPNTANGRILTISGSSLAIDFIKDKSNILAIFNASCPDLLSRWIPYNGNGYEDETYGTDYGISRGLSFSNKNYYSKDDKMFILTIYWSSVSLSISHNFLTLNSQNPSDEYDPSHDYSLLLRGIDGIDLEQQIKTEIKYSLEIFREDNSTTQMESYHSNYSLSGRFNGVILNSTISCADPDVQTEYLLNLEDEIHINCSGATTKLNRIVEKKNKMINYFDTQNVLGGIKDSTTTPVSSKHLFVLHKMLSIIELGNYSSIKAIIIPANGQSFDPCTEIFSSIHLLDHTEFTLVCGKNQDALIFNVTDALLLDPKEMLVNISAPFIPGFKNTPVFIVDTIQGMFSNNFTKKSFSSAVKYQYMQEMFFSLDFISQYDGKERYYLNIYDIKRTRGPNEKTMIGFDLIFSTISYLNGSYYNMRPTTFSIEEDSFLNYNFNFSLMLTIEGNSQLEVKTLYFSKSLKNRSLSMISSRSTIMIFSDFIPTHRFFASTSNSTSLFLMNQVSIREYTLPSLLWTTSYNYAAICSASSSHTLFTSQSYLFLTCTSQSSETPSASLIVYPYSPGSGGAGLPLNPLQLLPLSTINKPPSRIVSFAFGMLVTHPKFFLVQYKLNNVQQIAFVGDGEAGSSVKITLSNAFADSEFEVIRRRGAAESMSKIGSAIAQRRGLIAALGVYGLLSFALFRKIRQKRNALVGRKGRGGGEDEELEMGRLMDARIRGWDDVPVSGLL